jgi:CDGSH-type Zn-finger protein
MIVIFPRLPNRNVIWKCEYCNRKLEVTSPTRRVWLICRCGKGSPECNKRYYCDGEYLKN